MSRVCTRCEHKNTDDAKFCLNCGAMLEVAAAEGADPLVGKILLGRYRVLRELGEGGMGKVYVAEQKMGTAVRKVAIKTLRRELSSDAQLVQRFNRECETVVELHHPNTVQFYDFGELEDKTLFIVMEFIQGADLAHVLEHGPVDPSRADRLLIQICGSLHEAHQRGIVHRDLKPENILLTERGGQQDFVKVLDFGIAKRNDAEDQTKTKLTKQGMVLGTPPYMSPEQFSGQSLDFRSDIYSLGVMTYEMITGHLPFSASTPWEWATKHLTAQPIAIETYPQGAALAPHKRAAIARALSKNRDERQGSVLEFMHAFTGIQDAQAAWTMATSAGISASGQASFGGQPRPAIGTPQPMNAAAGGSFATPSGPMPAHGAGAMGHAPTQPVSAATTGGMPVQSGTSGVMKLVAAAAVLMVLVGVGGAGAIWWWTHRTPVTLNGPTNGPTAMPTTPTTIPTTVPQVPSTVPVGTSDPTPTPTTPTTPTPTPDPTPTTPTPDPDPTPDPTPTTPTPDPDPAPTPDPDPTPTTPTTPDPDPEPTRPNMRADRSDQLTEAQMGQLRNALRDAEIAVARNDADAAIRALAAAQRVAGRRNPLVRAAVQEVSRRGSNMVGILLQQGNCGQAQQLYRRLASVGAGGGAARFFSPDWCPRP